MHISLTKHLDDWVREKVESGLYSNASEVIREALRHEISREQVSVSSRLEDLRAAIQAGIDQADRGEFVEFSREDAKAYLRSRS